LDKKAGRKDGVYLEGKGKRGGKPVEGTKRFVGTRLKGEALKKTRRGELGDGDFTGARPATKREEDAP